MEENSTRTKIVNRTSYRVTLIADYDHMGPNPMIFDGPETVWYKFKRGQSFNIGKAAAKRVAAGKSIALWYYNADIMFKAHDIPSNVLHLEMVTRRRVTTVVETVTVTTV